MSFTWQESSETSLASLIDPLGNHSSINEVMVKEKWEVSHHKLLNNVWPHMGVTYLSDLCNAVGTHVLPEV